MLRPRVPIGCVLFAMLPACGSETECRTDAYPAAPAGVSSLVYVSAGCDADGADGSASRPYPRIQQAIERANAGAAVLVSPGTYKENLQIKKPVMIIGSSDGSKAEDAAIIVQAPADNAVYVTGTQDVTLRGLHIASPQSVGIWVQNGATTIEGSQVHNAGPVAGQYGYGILATDDAAIIVQHSEITGSALLGILIQGSTGTLANNAIHDNKGYGGIRVESSTIDVTIDGNALSGNSQTGIGIYSSRAIIVQNEVGATLGEGDFNIGDGIVAAKLSENGQLVGETHVTVESNQVTGNARAGVLFSDGAMGTITKNKIHNNALNAAFAAGIWVQAGAGGPDGLQIAENEITDNRYLGIGVTSNARAIIVQNVAISGTTAQEVFVGANSGLIGDGIGLFNGGFAQVENNAIQGNGRFGIILDSAADTSVIQSNTVKDNAEYGIIVQNQAMAPNLTMNTFGGNTAGDSKVLTATDTPFLVWSNELGTN